MSDTTTGSETTSGRSTITQLREKSKTAQFENDCGGMEPLFEITDYLNPIAGNVGILLKDNQTDTFTVIFQEDGTDARVFFEEGEAKSYAVGAGYVPFSERLLKLQSQGVDVYEVYGGRSLAGWLEISVVNEVSDMLGDTGHIHPEPLEGEMTNEQTSALMRAFIASMTKQEAARASMLLSLGEMLSGVGVGSDALFGPIPSIFAN